MRRCIDTFIRSRPPKARTHVAYCWVDIVLYAKTPSPSYRVAGTGIWWWADGGAWPQGPDCCTAAAADVVAAAS